MASVESRIEKINQELKALKAIYKVAGGTVDLVVQQSQVFHVNATANVPFKIRFTPNQAQEFNLIDLQPMPSSQQFIYENRGFENVPQTGNGVVEIQLGTHSTGTVNVQVVAIGTSKGTFSVV